MPAANLAGMEWQAPVAGSPVFLVPPGDLGAGTVMLAGPEGHHAATVRRLRPGERADGSDGAGTIANLHPVSPGFQPRPSMVSRYPPHTTGRRRRHYQGSHNSTQ